MKPTQQQIIDFCHSNIIIDTLGVDVVKINDDDVQLELTVKERHTNFYNVCHGGVLTTIADTAMGIICNQLNKSVLTMNLSIDFMHAVKINARIIAIPRIIHNGRQTMVCECDIVDSAGKLYSKVHATFFVIGAFLN
ncbi:MAG: PaaI family thioesterase [Selenomonadaceae bacterium]|nr:PaaI family thioesterase [Selenomonadaceae bacterium]